jgi:hypothetical protein
MTTEGHHHHFVPLESQAAGHANSIFRDLDHAGRVVKPVGERERLFYEQAQNMPEWQRFLPAYFGVVANDDDAAASTGLIGLQDLTHTYRQPCVLDLKVGLCTAAEDASAEKRANMLAKDARTTTHTLGLRICGMRVFDAAAQTLVAADKPWGKSLTADTFQHGLARFFVHAPNGATVIARFIERIDDLLAHMSSQTTFRFYSSSLLFVYEGDPAVADAKDVTLAMIDMAHVFPYRADDGIGDNGYTDALRRLRTFLSNLH